MADQAVGLLSRWLRDQRIKAAVPYIKGKVLDYGCGIGTVARICSPDKYVGVDIDRDSIEVAREAYPTHSFETSTPKTEKFDTIILLAVIEHIKSPQHLLGQLKDMLNSNGQIIMTTPHPMSEKIHYVGSRVGLFSSQANEEHEILMDYNRMLCIVRETGLEISTYKRFLFGVNQLFILVSKKSIS